MEIKSVSEYIKEIGKLKDKMRLAECTDILFFRGHSLKNCPLTPSVLRTHNCIENEGRMLNELFLKAPNDFNMASTFLKLTKVQHYGVPTRLLDISENPLVALYFACIDNNDSRRNGEVFCIADTPMNYETKTIEAVSILATIQENEFEPSIYGNALFDKGLILSNEALQPSSYMYYLKTKKYYIVRPPMNNERIIRQHGAFILFGIDEIGNDNKIIKRVYDIKNDLKNGSIYNRIIEISASNKKSILEELDDIGINESTLFPELEHQAKYIKVKYLKEC